MLDLEELVAPTHNGLNIVPLAEFKRHLRITNTRSDDDLTEAIIDAADKLHGRDGELNRTVFPTTWVRHFSRFPDVVNDRGTITSLGRGIIQLPYPPLIEVYGITINDGESPTTEVDPADYVVRTGALVGEVELASALMSWPDYTAGPRAISITYRAGYTTYPPKLKRMVKMLAAHYVANKEISVLEGNKTLIDRKVLFAMDDLRAALRVPVSYDDWA